MLRPTSRTDRPRTRAHRRATGGSPGPGRTPTLREWFTRRGRGARAWTSSPTGRATSSPGGAIPTRTGPASSPARHLDSVPDGGAFDGPLGVVSAFAALDALRADGFRPRGRSAWPASATRRAPGSASPARARGSSPARSTAERAAGAHRRRRRDDGRGRRAGGPRRRWGPTRRRCAGSARSSSCTSSRDGRWPTWAGPSPSAPRSTRTAAGGSTWPGRADHAGTTRLADRDDPMLAFAARRAGRPRRGRAPRRRRHRAARCTSRRTASTRSRRTSRPGWTRGGEDAERVRAVVGRRRRGGGRGRPRSRGPTARPFDPALATRLAVAARRRAAAARPAPGTTRASWPRPGIPTAMLFVRNPTGVSHSPDGARRGRRLRRRGRRA